MLKLWLRFAIPAAREVILLRLENSSTAKLYNTEFNSLRKIALNLNVSLTLATTIMVKGNS